MLASIALATAVAVGCSSNSPPSPGGEPPEGGAIEIDAAVQFGGLPGGEPLLLDAYLPAGSARSDARTAVVIVPGGAWRRGSRADMALLAVRLADAGHASFVIDYRRDDPHPFPGAVEDVARAIAFVRAQAPRYRIDPDRVALLGSSAGGNLAALAADEPRPGAIAGGRPKALVTWSAPTDLTALAAEAEALRDCDLGPPWRADGCTLPQSILARLPVWLGCPIDAGVPWLSDRSRPAPCPGLYRAGSPTNRVSPSHPPTLIVHAEDDQLIPADQAHRFAARLRAAKVPLQSLTPSGGAHGVELAGTAIGPTLRFLAER